MENIIAHIDEFGTNSLEIDKDNVSSHFLLCATLVSSRNIDEARQIVTKVRNRYFQNSEIKSSKVKRSSHLRRLLILKKLASINFSIYVIVVDKKDINSKGLSIKESFYKYFNKLLVQDLYRINSKITFIADQIGTNEFQIGFKEYINREVTQYDLFNNDKIFEFSNSQNTDLIQLSDFIVGSLAKCFDNKHHTENSDQYLKIIKDKLHVRFWPNTITNYIRKNDLPDVYNPIIAKISSNLANDYILKNEHVKDEDIRAQVHVLKYLLLMQRISPDYFVQTSDLINKLIADIRVNYQVRVFRKNIIGSLRDKNIIIVSANGGGYKLPVSNRDMIEFVNRYNGILIPMLSRMKKCRELLLTGSNVNNDQRIDILDYPEYELLKNIINEMN